MCTCRVYKKEIIQSRWCLAFYRNVYDRLGSASDSHRRHYLESRSDLRVFPNRRPFQFIRSMADLLFRVRVYVNDIIARRFEKVRNGHRFENSMPIWEFGKGHRFENWTPIWDFFFFKKKKDIYLRYRCLWRRNRTWIWGMDVDLSLTCHI